MDNMDVYLNALTEMTGTKFTDVIDGEAFILNGDDIPAKFMFRGVCPADGYYKLSARTCGAENGCEIGKPLADCIGFVPGECAVWSFIPIADCEFHLNTAQLAVLMKARFDGPIFALARWTEFSYRGIKYTRTNALCANAKDEAGREWQFHLNAFPDGVPGGQLNDPTPTDSFKIATPAGAILVDGE